MVAAVTVTAGSMGVNGKRLTRNERWEWSQRCKTNGDGVDSECFFLPSYHPAGPSTEPCTKTNRRDGHAPWPPAVLAGRGTPRLVLLSCTAPLSLKVQSGMKRLGLFYTSFSAFNLLLKCRHPFLFPTLQYCFGM